MKLFDYLNNNKLEVERLERAGLLKYKVGYYMAIYSRYLVYLQMGLTKSQSIERAASDLYTTRCTGFTAIKEMEKSI
jgi:hypothetical protein